MQYPSVMIFWSVIQPGFGAQFWIKVNAYNLSPSLEKRSFMSLLQKPFLTAKSAIPKERGQANAKEIQRRIKNVNLSHRLS